MKIIKNSDIQKKLQLLYYIIKLQFKTNIIDITNVQLFWNSLLILWDTK